MNAPNINVFYARLLIDLLAGRGITHFCLSSGSRSAPLAIAVAERDDLTLKVITDERASAFYAAGYAQAEGKPAAVICTSGTAVANLFPGVVEAYQSRLPLVLLTADRPEELQVCGANQTIDQVNIFGRFAPDCVTIQAPDDKTDPQKILTSVARLLDRSASGPCHINVRFREPLAPTEQPFDEGRLQALATQWNGMDHASAADQPALDSSSSVQEVAALVNHTQRGLIIAGPRQPFRRVHAISALSERLGWPMAVDILSQYRFAAGQGNALAHYDLYLDNDDVAVDLKPDLVIHAGGLPTSKRLNQFLLKHNGIEYVKLQDHERTIDPDHVETRRIIGDVDESVKSLLAQVKPRADAVWGERWRSLEKTCGAFLLQYFESSGLTEVSLPHWISRRIDDGEALYLSNSMPLRDADTFTGVEPKNVLTGANRGASGIDGVVASACGFAAGSRRMTTLVIGDLALIHDLNSLALVAASDYPVTIIVVNNNGGGIFHFLPVADYGEYFERCFGTPHGLRFERAAALFGLPYYHPTTAKEFDENYRRSKAGGTSALIEITGDRRQNAVEHRNIRSQIRRRLG